MERRSVPMVALLVVSLAFAGCTDGGGKGDASAGNAGEPGLNQGGSGGSSSRGSAIFGFVADDALNPLQNVSVLNENTNETVVSDLTGAFAFRGLGPDVYRLRMSRAGFEPRLERVNVVSNLPSWHNVTMTALPQGKAHQVEYEFQGFLECNYGAPNPTGGYAPNNCVPDHLIGLDTSPNSNARQVFVFPAAKGAVEALVEMVWQDDDTNPFDDKLSIAVEKNGTALGVGQTFLSYEGPSPARLELRPPVMPSPPYLFQTRTEVPAREPGLAFQQAFTVYVTVFYVDPMPDGFTRVTE